MGAVLTWLSGARKNERVAVDSELILGRGKHLRLILDDRRSSREHARVYQQGGAYFVEDLGSRNGTYLNDARLGREPVQLQEGDNIRIGLSWFCFGEPTIAKDDLAAFVGYTIHQQLLHHQGGMLLEAEQDRLGRKVQLRVLSMQAGADAETMRQRFVSEVRKVAKLVHPNLSLLLDFGVRGGYLFAAFEAHAGEELTDMVIAHHPLPAARAIELAREIASGLEFAHRKGICHHRLAPEVVRVCRGRPIVRDWGLSRLIDQLQAQTDLEVGAAQGLSPYLAPELISGNGSEASDIYSFGMLVYFLLAGAPPFAQTSPYELMESIRAGSATPLESVRPDTPAALLQAIGTLTALDPAERPADFGEVLALLDAAEREAEAAEIVAAYHAQEEALEPWQKALRERLANPTFCWVVFCGGAFGMVLLVWGIF